MDEFKPDKHLAKINDLVHPQEVIREAGMITIERHKCTRCGLCTNICHEGCMAIANGELIIDRSLCSTCTQCIAICPEQALSWNGISPVAYEVTCLPAAKQLDELFKERRTIRFFKKDKLPRSLVEEIVNYGIYAPTNNYALRAIVVDDQEILERLDRISFRFISRIYNIFFKSKLVFELLRKITPAIRHRKKRQRCLAHLIRKAIAISGAVGEKAAQIGQWILTDLRDLIEAIAQKPTHPRPMIGSILRRLWRVCHLGKKVEHPFAQSFGQGDFE